jgi:hypothetical protein
MRPWKVFYTAIGDRSENWQNPFPNLLAGEFAGLSACKLLCREPQNCRLGYAEIPKYPPPAK